MKYRDLENSIKFIYLNISVLTALFPDESRQNILNRLFYLEKKGRVIRLRRDFYIVTEQYNKYKNYPEYFELIACLIKTPSYLSLEYILRKYDVLSEGTYGFSLVTTKLRSVVNNKLGIFTYNQMNKRLYRGYVEKNFLDYKYYEATKAKALFDWLYYRVNIIQYNKVGINLIEDLRLNLETFTRGDLKELKSYLSETVKYQEKLKKIITNIIYYASNRKPVKE